METQAHTQEAQAQEAQAQEAQAQEAQAQEAQAQEAQAQEAQAPWRCSRCTDDPPENDQRMTLRCGHELHTQCGIREILRIGDTYVQCNICHTRMAEERVLTFLEAPRLTVEQIGQHPDIRADINEVLEKRKKYLKARKEYRPHFMEIKNRYKNNVRTAKEYIKEQQNIAIRSITQLPSYRPWRYSVLSYKKKTREFSGKYNMWGDRLNDLRRVLGVRVSVNALRLTWRETRSLKWMFRECIM